MPEFHAQRAPADVVTLGDADESLVPAYSVAREPGAIIEAWARVYDAYTGIGIIEPNPVGVHAVPEAIGPQSAVIVGTVRDRVVTTLTNIHDNPAGLPLDHVYGRELDGLRRRNRRISEVGLFADRRASLSRAAMAMFELMRFTFYYAAYWQIDDVLIGVHPHHAGFYQKAFGFEVIGDETVHPTVKNAPVILLRYDMPLFTAAEHRPKGLDYILRKPVSRSVFNDRFRFEAGALAGTAIQDFFRYTGQPLPVATPSAKPAAA